MVVPDAHTMLFGDAFEGMFGINGFLGSHGLVQVHLCEAAHMVSEHAGTSVVAGCWLDPCDWDKTRDWGFKLVNADHSTRYGGWLDLGINLVCPPWLLVGFAVETTGALRWRHIGQFLGDNTLFGKLLKLGERGVPELLMVGHQQ